MIPTAEIATSWAMLTLIFAVASIIISLIAVGFALVQLHRIRRKLEKLTALTIENTADIIRLEKQYEPTS